MNSNIVLAWGNLVDAATLSGGAWLPTLPLTALQDRVIAHVARSASAATADTQFVADLGVGAQAGAVALVGHTLSTAGRWRVTAAADGGFSSVAYQSDWLPAWPRAYAPGSIAWEDVRFWALTISDAERAQFTALAVCLLPGAVYARHWRIEIDDPGNLAGCVDVGRLFIGACWQPAFNAEYGASFGFEFGTAVDTALGGAEYFDRRRPRRTVRFQLPALGYESEAELLSALDLQRVAGTDGEVLFVWSPTAQSDPLALRRNFLGRLRQLSPIEHPQYRQHTLPVELQELL